MSELKDYDISLKTGFVPERVSNKLPGGHFAAWEAAARSLPQWTQEMRVRESIDALPDREFTTATLGTDEADWRWAYVVVSFLAQAYISEDTNRESDLVQRLPPKLSIPWQATSTHIGVPPAATYAAIGMYNYVLKDPSKPIAPENLQAALTFTGTSQESWFIVVHILEEVGAAPGLQAIMNGYKAMASNDNKSLVICLETITQSLRCMRSILKKMYEDCDPSFFTIIL
jgi:indoleamine 2,3-dioxygenase